LKTLPEIFAVMNVFTIWTLPL